MAYIALTRPLTCTSFLNRPTFSLLQSHYEEGFSRLSRQERRGALNMVVKISIIYKTIEIENNLYKDYNL